MQKMKPCLNAVLFMFLWLSSSLKLCQSNHTDCDFTERYDEVVTVSVKETVHVTKYKWCLGIPPRCPDNKQEYRTVYKNITIPKIRTVRQCCKDQIQLYDNCIPKCTEDQCPNIQCTPDIVQCKCKPGYIGNLCGQRCYVGYWGDGCENACQETCADACDHRTGRCVTRTTATATETLTTTTATTTPTTDRLAKATLPPPPSPTRKAMAAQARRPSVVVVVGGTDGVRAMRLESQNAETTGPSTQMATTAVTTSLPPGKMVSTVDVTVYKFDELIKKLIWISAMTVVAIAMVFVIMFVVFFNCYGAPKTPHDRNRSTASADDAAIHETCINTQNLAFASDRYTKAPTLQTSNKNDLPLHPEIFCPVFSAPHHTDGSTLYDSPQPLYEILC